nr:hypothetical protein [Tanacetum cinerariifolium]
MVKAVARFLDRVNRALGTEEIIRDCAVDPFKDNGVKSGLNFRGDDNRCVLVFAGGGRDSRRRVVSSDLDERPIRGKDVGLLIESDVFKKLDNNDAVSLCCVGILQFMKDMRRMPEANTTPIIADQHFGVSDISGFQSYQGVPSAFHTRERSWPEGWLSSDHMDS